MARRQRVSGWLRISVLAMLVKGPMHGYAMIKEIERITGGEWVPALGSLCPTLNELVKEGLVTAKEESIKGRKRVIYSITRKGIEYLVERADSLMSRAIPSILGFMESQIIALKLLSGPDELVRRLVSHLDFLSERISELRSDALSLLSKEKRDIC
ncbi:MAG: PadR family transcriptional regulator [Candidatus Korarchaeota archaeon]|nr:PadR family transcriptional regulator [Candidatus Korarchaeota archaeon]